MDNFWHKIRTFFVNIWTNWNRVDWIIAGLIIIAASTLIILTVKKQSDNKNVQIAEISKQELHPSIGEPLAPDVITQPTNNTVVVVPTSNKTEPGTYTSPLATTDTSLMVAPTTGIDVSAPIPYYNNDLKFNTTLPAHSNVIEENDIVKFTDASGKLEYLVSTNNLGKEDLTDIKAELQNSPSVSNIIAVNFNGILALKFKAKDFGTGLAFIAHDKIYYLFGQDKYFAQFKLD